MGIPYHEYSVMPIGELADLVSAKLIITGAAKEVEKERFIPKLR